MEFQDLTTFTALKDSQGNLHLILGFPRQFDILEYGKRPEDFHIDDEVRLHDGIVIYLVRTHWELCKRFTHPEKLLAVNLALTYRHWYRLLYAPNLSSTNQQLPKPCYTLGDFQRFNH